MKHVRDGILILLSLLLGAAAISGDSLWMDEGKRLYHALEGSWTVLWSGMQQDMQPLFFLQEWAWGHLFCFQDFVMRGMNLPFLAVAVVYLLLILRRLGLPSLLVLLLPLHPMTVYYMNDISPYIILLACTMGMLYHGFFAAERHAWRHVALLHVWLVTAYAYHFIAGFMGVIYACSLAVDAVRYRRETPWRRHLLTGAAFCVLYLPLTWFYLSHMHDGQGHGWGAPGAANAGYVLYALPGCQGLGLSRNALRAHAFREFTPVMAVLLAGHLSALGALLLCHARRAVSLLCRRYVLCLGVYALLFVAAAFVMKFQFWERHLMPLLAGVLVWEVQLAGAVLRAPRRPWLNRLLLAAVAAGLLTSSVRLRFDGYYGKEDFKGVLSTLEKTDWKQKEIPVLMQGHLAVWVCYGAEWVPVGQYIESPLRVKPGTMLSLVQLREEQVMACVHHLLRTHRTLLLVLSEKEESTPGLWQRAAEKLRAEGCEVQQDDSCRTFRILTVSRKSGSLLYSL